MRAWALLASCILFFSGCTGSDNAAQSVDAADADMAPVAQEGGILPQATDATASANLTRITEFYWATNETLPRLAFELRSFFDTENNCTLLAMASGSTDAPGPHSVFTYDTEGGGGWSSGGSGSLATIRSPIINTWNITGGSGGYASMSGLKGTMEGEQILTVLTTGVEVVPGLDDFTGGYALALQLKCEKPFDVTGARAGYETRLADETSMDDGVGYDVFLATQGGILAGFQHEITAGEGHVRFGSFGDQAGQVTLASPTDTTTFVLPIESSGSLQADLGMYSVAVDRIGAQFQAFWSAVYGLSHDVDLSAGLQDAPVLEDPFE